MYLTFEIYDFNQPIGFENFVIDNSSGEKTLGLRSVNLWVGHYNIDDTQRVIKRTQGRTSDDETVFIRPGMYSADELLELIKGDSEWIDLSIDRKSGELTIVITQEDKRIKMTDGLKKLLIFDNIKTEWVTAGTIKGRIDMQPTKCLYLHCEQLNRNETLFARKRNPAKTSTILDIIPIADKPWGGAVFYQYNPPVKKKLVADIISQLSFSLRNSIGKEIKNNKLPVILNLVIN